MADPNGKMQIELGKTYLNGYGERVAIVSSFTRANDGSCWFADENNDLYHKDGSFMQIDANPRFNLVEPVAAGGADGA